LNTRRTFALASLAFLAACATKPSTPPRAANAGASEMPGGLWTSGDELPPPRYARPVSPIPKQPPQAAPEPPRAVQRPQTVGPEARPLDRSSRGIPATYAGSVIPRTAWTSWLPDRSEMDALGKIRRITVHHEGNGAFTETSVAECRARIVNVLNGERGVGHPLAPQPHDQAGGESPIARRGGEAGPGRESREVAAVPHLPRRRQRERSGQGAAGPGGVEGRGVGDGGADLVGGGGGGEHRQVGRERHDVAAGAAGEEREERQGAPGVGGEAARSAAPSASEAAQRKPK
jgi:hypothetical protein